MTFQINFQDPGYRSGLVTRLRAGPSGSESGHNQQILLFLNSSITNLGPTQPSAQWVPGVFFLPVVNWPARGVGNLHLTSAEIKKVWSYTFAPPNTP